MDHHLGEKSTHFHAQPAGPEHAHVHKIRGRTAILEYQPLIEKECPGFCQDVCESLFVIFHGPGL